MNYQSLHSVTPLIKSIPLSQLTGKHIFLKMECYQPAGSFKIRGIGRLCEYYYGIGKRHFVSSSGGNAGYAVAFAGNMLGVPVTVFMPSTSKPIYVNALRSMGVVTHINGESWDEANQAALNYTKEIEGAYIPPFDHPLIWEGHATMIDEVAEAGIKPDAIVVAVGGGGLASGILHGLHHHGWYDVKVYTVETQGAASFAASVKAGHVVTLEKINTIATSLGAKRICQQLFDWTKRHPIVPLVISDKNCVDACHAFLDDHRVLTEPAGAAAVSVIYDKNPLVLAHQTILVIACGGIGISNALLQEYSK